MLPDLSHPKIVKLRAIFRIVVFIIFPTMGFWFSPNKAIYLALPISIGLALSIFQHRTKSNVHELVKRLTQMKGLKKVLALRFICILAVLTFYSIWMLFRTAD
jgi:hypothetical protein